MEITESVLFEDVTQASQRLQELRSLGIRIAVDDFGTGYSSLTYLDRLPVDLVKLDRSFVAGVGTDPTRTAIVTAVVNLALALGLDPVAEGIETEQQRADLYRLGCVYGQGFLIAPPMSAEELEAAMVVRWGSLRLRGPRRPGESDADRLTVVPARGRPERGRLVSRRPGAPAEVAACRCTERSGG